MTPMKQTARTAVAAVALRSRGGGGASPRAAPLTKAWGRGLKVQGASS